MKTAIEALGSLGVQAALSIMLVGTCSILWLNAQPVPNELLLLTGTVVAHWMGRKGVESAIQAVNPTPPPVYIPTDQQ